MLLRFFKKENAINPGSQAETKISFVTLIVFEFGRDQVFNLKLQKT